MIIQNGSDCTPAKPKVICVSEDGIHINQSIPKGMVVEVISIVGEDGNHYIDISTIGSTKEYLLEDITNQPTWTLDDAGLAQAVSDISGWL